MLLTKQKNIFQLITSSSVHPLLRNASPVGTYLFANKNFFSTQNKIVNKEDLNALKNFQNTPQKSFEYGSRIMYMMRANIEENSNSGFYASSFLQGYKSGIQSYWLTSTALKAGVGGLLYFCVHPIASVAALLWFCGTYQRMVESISFGNKFVVRMDLINSQKVKVYFDNSEYAICDTSKTEYFGMVPMRKDKGLGVKLKLHDAESDDEYKIRMLIFADESRIENLDLLKQIMTGNQEAISQFEFSTNAEDEE
jgi:hypothetical protein